MKYGQQSLPLRVTNCPCKTFTSFDRARIIGTFLLKHADAITNNITVYKQYPYGVIMYLSHNAHTPRMETIITHDTPNAPTYFLKHKLQSSIWRGNKPISGNLYPTTINMMSWLVYFY
jgi:hypothetical protein